MKLYYIAAQVTREKGPWRETTQIPTFILDEGIQAITGEEHAKRIAKKIIDPFESPTWSISVGVHMEEYHVLEK